MKRFVVMIITGLICYAFFKFEAAFAYDMGDVMIHGFISQGYMGATEDQEYMAFGVKDGTFQFNEMGINFSNNLTDSLRLGIQLLAFDLGQLGNDEVVLDWAFADYRFEDYLGFRAGLLKIPHGLYNETRDIDFLRTTIFLPECVYGELFRDAFSRMKGVGLYGSLPFGILYQAIYGTVSMEPDGGLLQSLGTMLTLEPTDASLKSSYIVNLQWLTPLEGLRLGGSYYNVDDFEFDATSSLFGQTTVPFDTMASMVVSAEYMIAGFTFAAEYVQNILDFSLTDPSTGAIKLHPITGESLRVDTIMDGYYGLVSYRLTDWFVLGAYYSEFYFDNDDRDGEDLSAVFFKPADEFYLKDICLSFRFDINESWIAKVEAHKMDGTFLVVGDRLSDEDQWFFYAAKLSFSF